MAMIRFIIQLVSNIYGVYRNLFIRAFQCALLGVVAYYSFNLCVAPMLHLDRVEFFQVVGTLLLIVILKLTWLLEKGK